MPETFYRIGNHKVDHTKFGGVIMPSDYNTNFTNANTASRIENDRKFDNQCRRNILNRKNNRRDCKNDKNN